MVLVTSHGFHGAYLGSRHGVSMSAIAGEGTGMERDYDYFLVRCTPPISKRRKRSAAAPASARSRGSIRARSATRKVPVVFDPRVAGSLVGHLAGAINGASVARKTSFLRDKLGASCSPTASASSTIRCASAGCARIRSTAKASPGKKLALVEDGVLRSWLLDSATARELDLATTGHAQRGVSSPPSPAPTNLHLEPGRLTPGELIADIADGFYVTDLIGMGVNMVTGDYSRGASGFWIENGELTYPVSEVTIAGI